MSIPFPFLQGLRIPNTLQNRSILRALLRHMEAEAKNDKVKP